MKILFASILATAATLHGATLLNVTFEEGRPPVAATALNSILDTSGNKFHGSPVGSPTYIAVTFPGSAVAMHFAGSQKVVIPDNALFYAPSFTISGRFRTTAANPSGSIFFHGDDRPGLDPRTVSVKNDRVYFRIEGADGISSEIFSNVVLRDTWTTFQARFDGPSGYQEIAIDGVVHFGRFTTVRPLTKLDPTLHPGIAIGGITNATTSSPQWFIGDLDDITFTNDGGLVPPTISPQGVKNGASGALSVQNGSWISIFGANLARVTRIWKDDDFVDGKLPKTIETVSVRVNNKDAFVYFVSPGQLNVLAPDDNSLGPVQVVVTTPWGTGTSTVQLQNFSPGWFMFDPDGRKYPAAVHLDGTYLGKPGLFGPGVTTRPAKPGEIISFYGTGFGPTDPLLPSADLVLRAAAIVNPNGLQVSVGDLPATVQFAGKVGSGLYQVNVVIPENLPDGDHLLVARIGGQSTQTIAALGAVYVTVKRGD